MMEIRKTRTVICEFCKVEFTTECRNKIFCSKKCQYSLRNIRIRKINLEKTGNKYKYDKRICEYCKKEFYPTGSKVKLCSRKCASNARKKYFSIPQCLENPLRKIDKNIGYVRIYCPMHPKANTRGYVYEHRVIMESVIGRYLIGDEVVHHINGIRWDNRIENLKIMSSSEHSKLKP